MTVNITLNITLSTFLFEYLQALNNELKFMRGERGIRAGGYEFSSKMLLGYETLSSVVPRATKCFLRKALWLPPFPTYLMYTLKIKTTKGVQIMVKIRYESLLNIQFLSSLR